VSWEFAERTEASAQNLLKIGEVRSRSGCSIQTIRYYESLGLIQAVDRTAGGFRLFAPSTLDRLAFVKQAQSLGMSLQDISELLTVYDSGNAPCSTVKHKLRDKLADLDRRIQSLQRLRDELQSLLAVADDLEQSPGNICPIVERASRLHQVTEGVAFEAETVATQDSSIAQAIPPLSAAAGCGANRALNSSTEP
jgi:DNA-binding transcriptional MerR regulator